ncbi:MAG: hypothetical protein D4R81_12015 [Nitrospiraceae bacterium]|nr:MAG: hypothetical protein D4R81_12015 [Nitrospiraceae bacterium]
MLALEGFPVKDDFAAVARILENVIDGHLAPGLAGSHGPAPVVELPPESGQRRVLGKLLKHEGDARGLVGVFHQALAIVDVAIRDIAPVPHALGGALVHLVAGAVRRHFPFKLSEVEQDITQ